MPSLAPVVPRHRRTEIDYRSTRTVKETAPSRSYPPSTLSPDRRLMEAVSARVAMKRMAETAGVQPAIPVNVANTNAVVASHRMSPASVLALAEIVESTLVNMIGLLPNYRLAANAAAPVRSCLGEEALWASGCARSYREAVTVDRANINVQKMSRSKGDKTAVGAGL